MLVTSKHQNSHQHEAGQQNATANKVALNPSTQIEVVQVAVLLKNDARVLVLARPSLGHQSGNHANAFDQSRKQHRRKPLSSGWCGSTHVDDRTASTLAQGTFDFATLFDLDL